VRALDFAVEVRRCGFDVGVRDVFVEHVPMELGLEIGAVVGLHDLDAKRQALQDVVEELDSGLLIAARVDPQHTQPGAVVDGGELVVLRPSALLG
jgi:hypothetical protein